MKKTTALISAIIFFVTVLPVQAQEVEAVKLPVPKLLVHANANDPISYYLLGSEGEILGKKELKEVLSGVEENIPLIKQANILDAGMWTSVGVGLAGVALGYINEYTDLLGENEWAGVTAVCTTVVGLCGTALCSMFSNAKFIKAADNYNLYILGIPVAGRR